ncbi:MAG: capsule assembly Wzi family protein, partial [bacterium]
KKILADYELEFEYDIYRTVKKQINIITKKGLRKLFNNHSEKHLYYFADSAKTIFTDLSGSVSNRGAYRNSSEKNSALRGDFGMTFRGVIFNSVAFYLKLSDRRFANANDSNIIFASSRDPLLREYNNFSSAQKKINSPVAYLRYRTKSDWLSLTFGRTHLNYGFGYIDKLFLSGNTLPFDFGKIDIKYKTVGYSFAYGNLNGDSIGIYPEFSSRELSSKNIATHNLNINFSDALKISLWESVIISNQPFSFTYLNPLSFLTSADLSTGAEQTKENNTLLGFDVEIDPVKNLSLQSSLLIDDLTFGTIGKNDSLNENKFGWQIGALWSSSVNINFAVEFTHLDPFVYSHRSNKSTYTNRSMSLGHSLPPNSDEIAAKINFDITSRLNFKMKYQHQRSGEGIILDSSGNLIANYGGNINFGLGDAYLRTNRFLDGTRINRDIFTVEILWQLVRQLYVEGKLQYRIINNITEDMKYNDLYYFAALKVDL